MFLMNMVVFQLFDGLVSLPHGTFQRLFYFIKSHFFTDNFVNFDVIYGKLQLRITELDLT